MSDVNQNMENSRRKFLRYGLMAGAGAVAGHTLLRATAQSPEEPGGETVKVLTTDGKLVEIPKSAMKAGDAYFIDREEARKGIPDRKFVMVIDLAKCANARACTVACQKGHHLPQSQEFMRVYLMQDGKDTAPYWFPKPCYHCDKPQCVSVCPVGATYKRTDGIVLVDNERCIGCKFCMTGCPYSARVFAWEHYPEYDVDVPYSPETSVPGVEGTVSKCDFCPDLIRVGKLPYCASACPMGVIYFGDIYEDIVTNGSETVRFSELIRDRGGYTHMANLGTKPSVYYLPPVNRQFPVDRGFDGLDPEVAARYENTPYVKSRKEKL